MVFGRRRPPPVPTRAAGTAHPEQVDPWLRLPGDARIELVRHLGGLAGATWDDYSILDATAIAALMVNNPAAWQSMVLSSLRKHGPRCARYLTAAGMVSAELAPLAALSSRFVSVWVRRELLTERMDEPEARAAFLLALADEIPQLARIAATAVMALPPDHPQRDEARVTSALTSMLHSAVTAAGEPDADWAPLSDTFLTAVAGLVQYGLYPEARLEEIIAAAQRVMRGPNVDDLQVARKEIAVHRLAQAHRARDRGEDELASRLDAEAAHLFGERVAEETDPAWSAAHGILSAHAAGNAAALADEYERLAAAPDPSPARDLATSVLGRLAQESGDDQKALDLLVPTLDDLERRYLAAVLERDVSEAGQAFAAAVTRVSGSYARLGSFGAAVEVLERGKSLRLRHRAWLRTGPQGDALRDLEADIDAAERGLAPQSPLSPSLTGLLERWRMVRANAGDAGLLRPGVREIAAVLAADEAAVVLGDTPTGLIVAVIRAGDEDEPSFATLLPAWRMGGIQSALLSLERGWWFYRGFGPGFVAPHDALAVLLDAAELFLGREMASALSGWDVDRVTVIPHLLLHLVPYWALPSLARYRVMTVPSVAQLVRRRDVVPRLSGHALVVGNPTGDLDLAAGEAAHVAGLLRQAGYAVTLRQGPEATEPELVEQAAGCGLVHFSGHGLSDMEVPIRSALEVHAEADADLLTRLAADAEWQPVHRWVVNRWVRSDELRARISGYGWLDYRYFPSSGGSQLRLESGPRSTLLGRFAPAADDEEEFGQPVRVAELWSAGDIMTERTLAACRLAVLSACDAGAGQEPPFIDECAGLPAALELAGVTTVVSPLWPVSVELAAAFAAIFYEYLAGASGPLDLLAVVDSARHRLRTITGAEAADLLARLRPATGDALELLRLDTAIEAVHARERPFANPFDWAAFTVTGAPVSHLPGDRDSARIPLVPDRYFELQPVEPVPATRMLTDVFHLAEDAEQIAEASGEPILAQLAAEKLVDRGRAHARVGHTVQALRDFRRAAELDPRNVASRVELMALAGVGDPHDALRQCDEILAIDARDGRAQLTRARALIDLDRLGDAERQLDRLLAADPENMLALEARCTVHRRRGAFDRALADIDAALALCPERWAGYQLRADLLIERGDADRARADARRAAFLAPDEAGTEGKALHSAAPV